PEDVMTGLRQSLFTVHMWIGLILGLLLAALGLSGSLLVYDDALASLINPPPRATTAGQPLPLSMIQDIAGETISVRMGGISPMGNMPGMNGNDRPRGAGRRHESAGEGRALQLFIDPV